MRALRVARHPVPTEVLQEVQRDVLAALQAHARDCVRHRRLLGRAALARLRRLLRAWRGRAEALAAKRAAQRQAQAHRRRALAKRALAALLDQARWAAEAHEAIALRLQRGRRRAAFQVRVHEGGGWRCAS